MVQHGVERIGREARCDRVVLGGIVQASGRSQEEGEVGVRLGGAWLERHGLAERDLSSAHVPQRGKRASQCGPCGSEFRLRSEDALKVVASLARSPGREKREGAVVPQRRGTGTFADRTIEK